MSDIDPQTLAAAAIRNRTEDAHETVRWMHPSARSAAFLRPTSALHVAAVSSRTSPRRRYGRSHAAGLTPADPSCSPCLTGRRSSSTTLTPCSKHPWDQFDRFVQLAQMRRIPIPVGCDVSGQVPQQVLDH